jgi:hypothetical protein
MIVFINKYLIFDIVINWIGSNSMMSIDKSKTSQLINWNQETYFHFLLVVLMASWILSVHTINK